jgi:hypothetical protein
MAAQARLAQLLLLWEADTDPATQQVRPTAVDQAVADLVTRQLRSMHPELAQQDRVSSAVLVHSQIGQVAAEAERAALACQVPRPMGVLAEQAAQESNGSMVPIMLGVAVGAVTMAGLVQLEAQVVWVAVAQAVLTPLGLQLPMAMLTLAAVAAALVILVQLATAELA